MKDLTPEQEARIPNWAAIGFAGSLAIGIPAAVLTLLLPSPAPPLIMGLCAAVAWICMEAVPEDL